MAVAESEPATGAAAWPSQGDRLDTFPKLLLDHAQRNGARPAMREKDLGIWQSWSWADAAVQVRDLALGLAALGFRRGDKLGIIGDNRPHLYWSITAAQALGGVPVPVYQDAVAAEMEYVLDHAEVRFVVAEDQEQVDKLLAVRARLPRLEAILYDDPRGMRHYDYPFLHAYDAAQERGRLLGREHPGFFEIEIAKGSGADVAVILYTSGTTGQPKGVMLTHGNLASNLEQIDRFEWTPGEVGISFLPLSHITARHLDYTFFKRGVTIAYCPNWDLLPQTLREVRPTVLVGVPRVYEKARAFVERQSQSALKRPIYNWALGVGRAHKAEVLAGKQPGGLAWKVADALLFSKVRNNSGGRVRTYISGGAPLGTELAEWFASVGVVILEGYGLTETSPVIAVNTPAEHKLGSVGKPLPNLQVKIAEDGEILVKGPSVFKSYWNLPEETRNAFEDGWFKTGDIGALDADGYLTITDRKKDLIKTSGGKFIAPQPIENALKANPLVAQAAVIGDRRKYAVVIISPDFRMLEDWARANRVAFAGRQQLVAEPRIRALFDGIVANVNQRLAQFETLKKVLLVPDEFSVASGELTPSMKLRRRVVEERYQAQIEALYAVEKKEEVTAE
jgi:long-chain acyl-CoA synthetase